METESNPNNKFCINFVQKINEEMKRQNINLSNVLQNIFATEIDDAISVIMDASEKMRASTTMSFTSQARVSNIENGFVTYMYIRAKTIGESFANLFPNESLMNDEMLDNFCRNELDTISILIEETFEYMDQFSVDSHKVILSEQNNIFE